MSNPWSRALLVMAALMFLGLGLNGLFQPLAHLAPYALDVVTPTWLGEIRANYGGMHIGIGLLLALGAWRADWRAASLAVLLVFLGGLAVGRTLSVVVDGVPEAFAVAFIVIEWLGALLAALCLRAQLRETVAA